MLYRLALNFATLATWQHWRPIPPPCLPLPPHHVAPPPSRTGRPSVPSARGPSPGRQSVVQSVGVPKRRAELRAERPPTPDTSDLTSPVKQQCTQTLPRSSVEQSVRSSNELNRAATSMSLTVLQLLPDDVLLEVMQYLSVEDVFACRLVCKRLEALARDPTVWCHRRIDMHRPRAVLRLAPCLGAIVCKAHHEAGGFQGDPDPAFEATKCAVTSLNFELTAEEVHMLSSDEDFPSRLAYFARVVRNQVTLGRLKHVTVQIRQLCGGYFLWMTFSTPRGAADALLDALAQSSCLQSLRFLGWVPSATRPLRVSSKSSLLHFECWLSKKSESFVKAMLTAHADTLEEVSLFDREREMGNWGSHVASPETTELLARMPRLQRLKYDIRLSPIDAFAACKTLKDVTLSKTSAGYGAADPPLSKTLKFLSEANQLRSLTIHPCYDNCEELMEAALVSSALSLERLFISGDQSCGATSDSYAHMKKVQQLLIRTLPRLPALRQLTWNPEWLFQCDELLLAITPLSAPALRRLELISTIYNDRRGSECDHRWLHSAAVRATLAANPLLHIHLRNPQACIN